MTREDASPQPFPWDAAMRFGFGRLRLSSQDFWALTPAELGAAARDHAPAQTPALDRASLADLLARYPDAKDA